jgi:lipopolysaccharide/colanic/teichoic acid biosynthesis glycosyltransferase
MNRLQILYFYFGILIALLVWRIFYQKYLASYRFEKKVNLICDANEANKLILALQKIDPHYRIIAYINSDNPKKVDLNNDFEIVKPKDLQAFATINFVSEIVVASKKTDSITVQLCNQLLQLLETGFTIREYTQVYESMTQRIPIEHFGKDFYKHFPFSRNNQNKLYQFIIRILEIIFSIIGLIIGLHLLPFIFIGNQLANRGKLFYTQSRIGCNGKPITIYKLQTMLTNAETNGAVFTTINDSRINTFGKFLRKTRLDEIPQFINILKGDMAFIGLRPERPFFVEQLSQKMPFYETRHIIKPGLTGWAQVNYSYGETHDDSLKKLQYDLYYIKHRSIFLDLNIVIKTFSTILFYRGQ